MSKLMFFDFSCDACNYTFEDLVKPDVHQAPCPECDRPADRLVSTPTIDPRMGVDPVGNPTMGDKWARTRKRQAQIARKHYKDHGADLTPGADTRG